MASESSSSKRSARAESKKLARNATKVSKGKQGVKFDSVNERNYYQGERRLTDWERKHQMDDSDNIDLGLIDWETFDPAEWDWERCSDANSMVFEHLRPILQEAIHGPDAPGLDAIPAYLRYWIFPGDDVPALHSGAVAVAVQDFEKEVEAHGKFDAGVKFVEKMIQAHADSERLGVNYHDHTAKDWVRDGFVALTGPGDSDAQSSSGDDDELYKQEFETEADIAELLRQVRLMHNDQAIADALRAGYDYFAWARNATNILAK